MRAGPVLRVLHRGSVLKIDTLDEQSPCCRVGSRLEVAVVDELEQRIDSRVESAGSLSQRHRRFLDSTHGTSLILFVELIEVRPDAPQQQLQGNLDLMARHIIGV